MADETIEQRVKEKHPRRIFLTRLTIDGQDVAHMKCMKETRAANPSLSIAAVRSMVDRQFGYMGAKGEREWYTHYLEKLDARDILRVHDRREAERKEWSVESVIAELPDKASDVEEVCWIKNHPAMMRRNRSGSEEAVLITVEDVECPTHGRAPSKYAAHALQHWVNLPGEFFKMVLSNQTKKPSGEGKAADEVAEEMGLEEIEKMLEEMA